MRHRSHPSPLNHLRAREMRSHLNLPEQLLWVELRGGRLGTPFRRQVPIARFIVDFLAPRERLVVEVDGGYHAGRCAADARRDRKLERLGYRVLRVNAELVVRDVTLAVALVRRALRGSP